MFLLCFYFVVTFEGFKITVHSAIKATKFLLEEGMEYVLTERFCQDPVKEYFGNQRTTLMYTLLDTITTPLEYREQHPVKVGILEIGRTGVEFGFRLPMTLYHLGKNIRILEQNNIQSFLSSET